METRSDEVGPGIYRLSTFIPGLGGPAGFTFNQYLIEADEPLLYHCGQQALFPGVIEAVKRVMDPGRLRWIAMSHGEADESGALNQWLAAAPEATAMHGRTGCNIWLKDTASRPPRQLADGEVIDLGGRKVRHLDTPHVPHCWDASLLFEETTATLFTSDLFTQVGGGPASTGGDILGPAIAVEEAIQATSLTTVTAPTVRRLAELKPGTLALMHGPAYEGDGAAALNSLADYYDGKLRQAVLG